MNGWLHDEKKRTTRKIEEGYTQNKNVATTRKQKDYNKRKNRTTRRKRRGLQEKKRRTTARAKTRAKSNTHLSPGGGFCVPLSGVWWGHSPLTILERHTAVCR